MANGGSKPSSRSSRSVKSRICQHKHCQSRNQSNADPSSPYFSLFCRDHACPVGDVDMCPRPKRTKNYVCDFRLRCRLEGCGYKVDVSEKDVVLPTYCPRHKCKRDLCHLQVSPGSRFCATHAEELRLATLCRTQGCAAGKSPGSHHCPAHRCEHCARPSEVGRHCREHVHCTASGCGSYAAAAAVTGAAGGGAGGDEGYLCSDHRRCRWTWGCQNVVTTSDGAPLCREHKCSVERCQLERDKRLETQLGFCAYHKCFMEGCESPTPNADGDMRHRFCEAHTCKWKDCYSRVSLLDGYLCEEHLRPGDRDREGARARNPSDSGYGDFSEPRTYPGGSVAAGAAGGGVGGGGGAGVAAARARMPANGCPSPPHTGNANLDALRQCHRF